MLEIGKVPVNGQALETILEEVAGDSLLREAMGPDGSGLL
jgi:hypothetical protein